ncbi:sphingomyelin phosphodiesterase 4, neutral membrane (neutral sphingomyelinase-3) [Entomortierella chlamydospora]|uniref:Sphingomyelin phosphodiesterase 4, neutral membrane (Neutral sphingomyelinase-3) n=1 Tax=Entomortierella chlamydospora TaxID=101097 RepID=A0A9P6T0N7_9FUNG|nr:sphingomyelin phosphodiesterase 4, neutral membrane (neutral sphingomyelinase-3) [Entomortierella chlamydospora]
MSFEGLDRLLVGSVPTACANLTNHLNQCFDSDVHAKSFFEFLPRLCQILYGSKESRGWLHLPLSKAEEDPLYELIRPKGVLMRFLLSRYTDSGFIYEMVPDSLPKRTQSKLDPTQYLTLPPIYLSRVNLVKTIATVGTTQKTMAQVTKVNLNFNMLEYFLFYFAYALTLDDDDAQGRGMRRSDPKMAFKINGPPVGAAPSGGARSSDWTSGNAPKAPTSRVLVDGSFFNLFHQYLHYFIPAPERPKDAPNTNPDANSLQRPLSVFNDQAIENSADRQQTQLSISEFFIGTLVELWLGQNDKAVDNRTIRYVQPGADIAECISVLVSHLHAHDASAYVLGGDLVPSHIIDSTGKSVLNLAGMARRSAYQYIRPQLYTFLQLGLQFWPLDNTFPSLVNTWMIWITPWRYGRRDPSVAGDVVSEKWQVYGGQPFIFDNLLFYTALLELYMPRLSHAPQTSRSSTPPTPMTLKMELRSIQRVMKVFKADNLKEILKVAEQAIVWPENFSDSSYAVFESLSEGNPGGASSARPDATSVFLSSMVNALQRQIQQLEGHQYKYEALFLVEGPGRSKIRMILTKLGNAVDIRQERLAALEAKSKLAAEQTGLSALTSAISNIFAQPAPTTVSQDTTAYLSELKGLRDTMTMIGEVFDLYPSVVTSFEKQHQGTQDRGSTLTAEQLEALIPPLEEEESAGLLRPEKQRKYVPRGLVKRSVDEVKASGPRAEQLVLTYEIEFIVKLTRRAEDYLTPKTVPQRRVQELRTTTTTRAPEISNVKISGYDTHVEPVYHWERPGQASSTITRQRFTRPAEPRYTIDVQDIEG